MRPFLLALALLGIAARDTSSRRTSADPRSFKQLKTVAAERAYLLSPAGRHFAVYAGNSVTLYDALTGKEHAILEGHTANIHDGGWSRDGRVLATSSYDGTVRLWNVIEGKEIRSIAAHAGYA